MNRRQVGNIVRQSIDLWSLTIGLYGVHSTILTLQLPPHLEQAGHWQFLTNISLVISLVVFGLGFLAHLIKSDALFNVKNRFNTIALILEIVVAVVYWPLRVFFLHLLVKNPDEFKLPLKTDMAIHLMPVVSLAIDYFFFMPQWETGPWATFVVVSLLALGYWFHLDRLIDFESGGRYPYTFLEVETNTKRAQIFGIIALFAYSQYFLMKKLYEVINAKKETSVEKKSE